MKMTTIGNVEFIMTLLPVSHRKDCIFQVYSYLSIILFSAETSIILFDIFCLKKLYFCMSIGIFIITCTFKKKLFALKLHSSIEFNKMLINIRLSLQFII